MSSQPLSESQVIREVIKEIYLPAPTPEVSHVATQAEGPTSASVDTQNDDSLPRSQGSVDLSTLTSIPVAAARMESRALAQQGSLSALDRLSLGERDPTITSFAALQTPRGTPSLHSNSDAVSRRPLLAPCGSYH